MSIAQAFAIQGSTANTPENPHYPRVGAPSWRETFDTPTRSNVIPAHPNDIPAQAGNQRNSATQAIGTPHA